MEWIQTLTIIGVFAAFFIYLMSRIDNLRSELRQEFHQEIGQLRQEFHQEMNQLRQEMNQLRQEMQQGFSNLQNYILLGKIDKKIKEEVIDLKKEKE